MKLTQLANIGLNTYTNPLSAPPGSATICDNVVIDKPGEIETRRGFDYYGTQLNTTDGPVIRMVGFQNSLIVWYGGGKMAYDSDGAGTWINYSGTYLPPTDGFINTCLAAGNLYFTTSNGVYKLDKLTNTPQPAGAPRGLDGVYTLTTVSGGFLANNSQVAYRIVWGYFDANNNLILGSPSDFLYASNSGSAAEVNLTYSIPSQANSTTWFYQIYRTPNTGSLSITPGDNLQLAIELNLTNTDLSNGYIAPTDNVPDALLGAYLYTDSTQLGESQTNDQPPFSYDICQYLDMTLYSNCQTKQTAYITLDSTGSPNGIQSGDTITINGTVFTADTSNSFSTGHFAVVTGGTIASNINATALNLVLCVNQYATNTTIAAYYISTATSLPGQILLEARNYSQGIFVVTSSRATCWDPEIPSSGTTYASENTALPNQVYSSQPSQPEAVPIGNVIPVASQNYTVDRIFPLRTGTLTWKGDGTYLLNGTSFPLTVTPVDVTVFMFGNNTAVPLNNSIYTFTTQAVCQGAESGVEIQSHVIEDILLGISELPSFASLAFGIQYESERKYILFVPTLDTDTYCTQAFVWNWVSQTWVRWIRNATAGIVTPKTSTMTPADVLFLARPDGWIVKENKSRTLSDYHDESIDITIDSINSSSNTFTLASASGMQNGDVIVQNGIQTIVQQINSTTNVVTVSTVSGFNTGAAIDYASYLQTVSYQPINGGWVNAVKRWSTLQFAFASVNFNNVTLSLSSDFYPSIEQTILVPKSVGGWGDFPFGGLPFGLTSFPTQVINTYATNNTTVNTQLFVTLQLQQAFSSFGLSGVTGNFNIVGERWF